MILVTGGTGFLGSTLIKQLIDEGVAVVATKRSESVIPEYLKSSSLIQWVDADINDYFALEEAFEGISHVFHCAAMISYQPRDASQMMKVNIEGTRHIVNLCLQHSARLVHVSSIAALGTSKSRQPVTEQDKWEYDSKISKYSLSKYESELEVWRGVVEGLDAVIVNPSVIIGATAGKKGSGAIFSLVDKGLKVYPTGSVGVVDVEDVAKLMIILMNKTEISGERFILNTENLTNKALLDRISILMQKPEPTIAASPTLLSIAWRAAKFVSYFNNKPPAITKDSARASSAKLAYSNKKIIEATQYSFRPLDETLKEITATYQTKTE
ncbi:ADP-L-glycero-D-manno-heptose-6-epimerase [Sphingobacterium spiritivorum]|uniref:ADP-L-glycero-D-manno-heptose-6-epimerase n=1 Tax=Sphingobacterium spiritivorum TaxID=258 RepID=A0A380C2X8_SPHSI|nr:SDR family NAD(P)-dependent oxidoreductase [Sphingobacterium spiritivorum]SUJ10731.1 ADP-L-glycero-D-manno-heptose-6-epimerase [Sphingobacterium spiritivorum]